MCSNGTNIFLFKFWQSFCSPVGQADGRKNGRMDGWIDGWMDGLCSQKFRRFSKFQNREMFRDHYSLLVC